MLRDWDFRHFDEKKRVPVDLAGLNFAVLDDLFREGEAYVEALEKSKDQSKKARAEGAEQPKKKKQLAGNKLKDRDAW